MTLAGDAGIDVNVCEFCDQRVRRNATVSAVTGLDGMRAHRACVDYWHQRERRMDALERRELRRILGVRSFGEALA